MFYGTEQELRDQLNRIESKLDQLLALSQQKPTQASTAPDPYAEVRASLAQGMKIQAIKLYREITGVGLKEAKEAVEAMQSQPVSAQPSLKHLSEPDLEPVRTLMVLGKKIDAIKLYRELTGVGLKEAKDAVEAMPLTGSSW